MFYHQSFQNGIDKKEGGTDCTYSLCSLTITVRFCTSAEEHKLITWLHYRLVTPLPAYIYTTYPFPPGPKRRLAAELLKRESAPTRLAENGCCMWWWWRLRTLCCGLFLSCGLLWSRCCKAVADIINFFELILCKSVLFLCFHETWARHACNLFSLADNRQFSILVVIFMHCKKKIHREYGSVFIFLIWRVYLCVFSCWDRRGACCHLWHVSSTPFFCSLCAEPNLSLCVITDSVFPALALPHCFALYLTFSHTLAYTLTTTGAIRKPTRGQFSHNPSLFFSPSACSVSLCWLLSRHCGTLACQRDIDWEGEGGRGSARDVECT